MPKRISHIERIAHAKVNLALHVTGQREDGYHLLDSLVVFTEFGDGLSVSKSNNPSSLVSLKIDGPFSEGLDNGANNLVSRAALSLGYEITKRSGKPTPVEIRLTKNLPIASGIGGGSADAAATLLALKDFWQSDVDLMPIAKDLGADIPMCLHSTPLRAQSIGDSTPSIFKQLTNKENTPMYAKDITAMPLISEIKDLRNDLQNPAIDLEPAIENVLSALSQTNAQLERMSGSGATCFGIYENHKEAQTAANYIKSQNPTWWCVATTTTVS